MAHGGAVVSSERQVVTGGAHSLPRAKADLTRFLLRTEARWRSMAAYKHRRRRCAGELRAGEKPAMRPYPARLLQRRVRRGSGGGDGAVGVVYWPVVRR
jgi:hypothetical protein